MSIIGSITKSFLNPVNLASLAMGPAGWAQIATRTLFSAVGQQVIQNLGQQMGLPQSVIDMAQAQFAASTGDIVGARMNVREAVQSLGEQFGLSPSEAGTLERNGADLVNQMTDFMLKNMRENGAGGEDGLGSANMSGKSRLVRLAVALGRIMDDKMDKMVEIGDKLDGAKKTGSLSAEMQGLAQELSMVGNALATTIKSIGEASTTLARKN